LTRSDGQRCYALRLLYLQEDVAYNMLKMIDGAARAMALDQVTNSCYGLTFGLHSRI